MRTETTSSEVSAAGFFSRFTTRASTTLGNPAVFVIAICALVVWAISGPFLKFSDTWQLIINTGTTIVTFLMVFIIQNSQNRDSMAMNLKLEALMHELQIANDRLYGAEEEDQRTLLQETRDLRNAATSTAVTSTNNEKNSDAL
ncbi:low affinity iron permease family protein [Glutamicibacter creatinolyticus]|uniref:low affinity iron permease family protein n=1 Tax=Glutamicibacter creatinolyticus TaxID=162496 RepID=UPI0031E2129F